MSTQQEVFELTCTILDQNPLLALYLAYSFAIQSIAEAYLHGDIDKQEVLSLLGKARATFEPEIRQFLPTNGVAGNQLPRKV